MRLRHIILLMLLLTIGTATRADEGRLYSSDCLTSTFITCITQDRHGFVWIGTQQGLNRFDGYRFTPYYYKPGNRRTISHNNVSMVYVSSNGTLWVGTAKGLMCYNEKNDDFKRIDLLPKTDDEPRIAGITEAPDGRVIVGTSGYGLFELKDTIAPPQVTNSL